MLKVQRLAIVWSSTIFFLVVSPVLAIYALGYDFDIKQNNLNNTVSFSVETAPDNAKINIYGEGIGVSYTSNSDFRVASSKQLKTVISKDGYLQEEFWIRGKSQENSLVRLKKIHLLPSNFQNTSTADSSWQNISFVSKDFILFSKESNSQNEWFLQQYSYNGFLGEPKPITAFNRKNNFTDTLNLPLNLDETQNPTISTIPDNSFFEELGYDTFWQKETQTLLFKDESGVWNIWQSEFLGMGAMNMIWLGQNSVLLHDGTKTKNVYIYDLNEDKLTYITDNIQAISLNNNLVWFLTQNKIFRVDKSQIFNLTDKNWSSDQGYSLAEMGGVKDDYDYFKEIYNFKVKNVYQGVILAVNNKIYYQPDSQLDKWNLITSNAQFWTSTWHSIFWIDTQNTLMTYNLELKYQRLVASINYDSSNEKILNLDYYAPWHRVFIYKANKNNSNPNVKVDSVWYNPDFINNEIRSHNLKNWLTYDICRTFIEGGYIFCISKDKRLVSYRNLN